MNRGLGAEWEDLLVELRAAHAEEIAPAAYAAVRARVLAELRPRRKWGWVWAAVGLAAVVVGLGLGVRMRVEELQIVARTPEIPAGELRSRPMPARMPAWRARGSLYRHTEEIVVKIETVDHPDVVIYWIAEAKGEE